MVRFMSMKRLLVAIFAPWMESPGRPIIVVIRTLTTELKSGGGKGSEEDTH